jgi:hypothetical protein
MKTLCWVLFGADMTLASVYALLGSPRAFLWLAASGLWLFMATRNTEEVTDE